MTVDTAEKLERERRELFHENGESGAAGRVPEAPTPANPEAARNRMRSARELFEKGEHHEAELALARAFPSIRSLENAQEIELTDEALLEWIEFPMGPDDEAMIVSFLLEVRNLKHLNTTCFFDAVYAAQRWEDEDRAAFTEWMNSPFFPVCREERLRFRDW